MTNCGYAKAQINTLKSYVGHFYVLWLRGYYSKILSCVPRKKEIQRNSSLDCLHSLWKGRCLLYALKILFLQCLNNILPCCASLWELEHIFVPDFCVRKKKRLLFITQHIELLSKKNKKIKIKVHLNPDHAQYTMSLAIITQAVQRGRMTFDYFFQTKIP